jgi:hypothetical protein
VLRATCEAGCEWSALDRTETEAVAYGLNYYGLKGKEDIPQQPSVKLRPVERHAKCPVTHV